jgi:hypothetical protein
MIGRLLLALFGMEQVYDRCPCCGARKLKRAEVKSPWEDPVGLYLNDRISADEMEGRL